jgi:hypothetical protein
MALGAVGWDDWADTGRPSALLYVLEDRGSSIDDWLAVKYLQLVSF